MISYMSPGHYSPTHRCKIWKHSTGSPRTSPPHSDLNSQKKQATFWLLIFSLSLVPVVHAFVYISSTYVWVPIDIAGNMAEHPRGLLCLTLLLLETTETDQARHKEGRGTQSRSATSEAQLYSSYIQEQSFTESTWSTTALERMGCLALATSFEMWVFSELSMHTR